MISTAKKPRLRRILLIAIPLLILAAVVWRLLPHGGAGGPADAPAGGPPGGAGGGMMFGGTTAVHSGEVTLADVPVYINALGTVTANASVTVTSRVDGQLTKVLFTEGQLVKEGQLLAQIDARSYQATLAQYQGALAENQAQLKSAELTLSRYQKLYAQDSLSRQDLDSQIATVGQYRGAMKADQAQIDAAKLNIEFASITAPVSGRVGLRLVDVGNMVHSSDTTGIVTITQIQPAAVKFSVPQSHIPVLAKALHQGQSLPATAFDQDGSTELEQGTVQFMSNEINTDTGTVELKALFANQDDALYPNQFVNVRLQTGTLKQTTVIPAQALQLSSDGDFVYVINQDNTVSRKAVKTGPAYGDDRLAVLSGVSAGEKVVTEGIDRLTNGSKVEVVTAQQSAAASGSAQAQ